jgi:hypothetical protein
MTWQWATPFEGQPEFQIGSCAVTVAASNP